jgi:hypothetical protein
MRSRNKLGINDFWHCDRRDRINKPTINKKYPFKQMQPGETFKLNDADIRSAQKMAR